MVYVARMLARESRDMDPDMDKHIKSAMALLLHSTNNKITIEEATKTLNEAAHPMLTDKLAAQFPASIGYHKIVDYTSIKSSLCSLEQERAEIRASIETRMKYLQDNREINDNWFGRSEMPISQIFNQFRSLVEGNMTACADTQRKCSFFGENSPLTYSQIPELLPTPTLGRIFGRYS